MTTYDDGGIYVADSNRCAQKLMTSYVTVDPSLEMMTDVGIF